MNRLIVSRLNAFLILITSIFNGNKKIETISYVGKTVPETFEERHGVAVAWRTHVHWRRASQGFRTRSIDWVQRYPDLREEQYAVVCQTICRTRIVSLPRLP